MRLAALAMMARYRGCAVRGLTAVAVAAAAAVGTAVGLFSSLPWSSLSLADEVDAFFIFAFVCLVGCLCCIFVRGGTIRKFTKVYGNTRRTNDLLLVENRSNAYRFSTTSIRQNRRSFLFSFFACRFLQSVSGSSRLVVLWY